MKGTDSKPTITAIADKEGNFNRCESKIIKNYLVHKIKQMTKKTKFKLQKEKLNK
jgi:hypothetical protein